MRMTLALTDTDVETRLKSLDTAMQDLRDMLAASVEIGATKIVLDVQASIKDGNNDNAQPVD